MIIDLILDRKDGDRFNAKSFYNDIREYENIFEFDDLNISGALEYGSNEQVQEELCKYIMQNGYNPEICDYIRSVSWIKNDTVTLDMVKSLAVDLILNGDIYNEFVTNYINGSDKEGDYLAYMIVKKYDKDFIDALNEYYGEKDYEYGLNYDLAKSFLAA